MTPCPCCSNLSYEVCCRRYHDGEAAPTAEALMRSRYAAYVLGNSAYLLATWHPNTRPEKLNLEDDPPAKWLGLEVRKHSLQDSEHATVEFVARWRVAGRGQRLHELSRFERNGAGCWLYLDGKIKHP